MSKFPTNPEELSLVWLSDTLGYEVKGFEINRLGEGIGIMGMVNRMTLDAEKGPSSLIVKFASAAQENREVAATYSMYEKEVNFYNDLAGRVGLRTPQCYFADFDPANQDCIVILEDLKDYRVGDQVEGCTLQEAHEVLTAIAGLHASTWGTPGLEHIIVQNNPAQRDGMVAGFQVGWPNCLERFPEVIPASAKAVGDRFADNIPRLLEEMCHAPLCLIHTDVRLDNILFGRDEVALVDWQAVCRSAPEQDVAYFVSQSVPKALRDQDELVVFYHAVLSRQLAEAGIDYSLEDCRARYEVSALYLLAYAVVIAGTLDMGNERGVLLARTLLDNSLTALEELDAFRLIV